MSRYEKKRLNIAFILFALETISVLSVILYIIAWEVLLATLIVSALSVMGLVVSVSLEAKYKEYSTHGKYNPFNHKKFENIFSNIGLWVNTRFGKFLKVINSITKTNQIKDANDTTNNHSFHTENLTQEQTPSQPKKNDT